MKVKHAFLTAIFAGSMLLSHSAMADAFEQAAAYHKSDLSTQAFKDSKALAEQGDATAQVNLGTMYYSGLGVAKNDKQAFYWYQKSAKQGNAPAQTALGRMYYYGHGTAKNKQKALYWFQKACQAGQQIACKANRLVINLKDF